MRGHYASHRQQLCQDGQSGGRLPLDDVLAFTQNIWTNNEVEKSSFTKKE